MKSNPSPPLGFDAIAFALAWLLPGLGHWFLGHRRRAVYIAIGVLGLVIMGVLVGGLDVVDRQEDHLWFMPQSLTGPLAFGLDAANHFLLKSGRVGEIISHDVIHGFQTRVNRLKSIGRVNEIGTLFVAIAGLLNLCVMLDAATRGRFHGSVSPSHESRARRADDRAPAPAPDDKPPDTEAPA